MISYIKRATTGDEAQLLETPEKGCWIALEEAKEEELRDAAAQFGFENDLLQDGVDPYEIPRIEIDDKILYIFTRFVYSTGGNILTAPLLIAVNESYVLTVSGRPFPRMERFINAKIPYTTTDKLLLVIRVLKEINTTYSNYLYSIGKKVFSLTKEVERISNRDIARFVRYEYTLYDLNSALVRMDTIYRSLMTGRFVTISEDQHDRVEDLLLENGQLLQIAKDNIRSIVNLRESYSTIMTNNLNRVIKLFTAVTIVLTVPTVVGTFYGMNVPIPRSDDPYTFWIILIATFATMAGILAYFYYRDWL